MFKYLQIAGILLTAIGFMLLVEGVGLGVYNTVYAGLGMALGGLVMYILATSETRVVTLQGEYIDLPVPLGFLSDIKLFCSKAGSHFVSVAASIEQVLRGSGSTVEVFTTVVEALRAVFDVKSLKEADKQLEKALVAGDYGSMGVKVLAEAALNYYTDLHGAAAYADKRVKGTLARRVGALLKWVEATRNLAAHSHYKPSRTEALLAAKILYELLAGLKHSGEARIYANCPDGRTVELTLRRGVKWFTPIKVCTYKTESGEEETYEAKLNSKLLQQHFNILCNSNKRKLIEGREEAITSQQRSEYASP